MRRLTLLLPLILVLVGFYYLATHLAQFGFGPSPSYFVAARHDIPAYTVIGEDAVSLRPIDPKNPPPPGSVIEMGPIQGSKAIQYVVNKAPSKAIVANAPIQADEVFPYDVLQRMRGSQVLKARARLAPGQPIDPTQFRSAFLETDKLPHGSITGAVGDRVEQLFEQFPAMWATKPVAVDGVLTFDDITFTDPGLHTDVPKSAENAPEATGPLNLDVPIGPMPRPQLLRRLMQTPGVVVLGEGVRGDSEVESAAGVQGPVDVFVSASRPAMRAKGLETHHRMLKGVRLGINTTSTAAAPLAGVTLADTGPIQQEAPVFWLRMDPEAAIQLNTLRATGALITVVPATAPLPGVDGSAVMCASKDLCYRTLTDPSIEETAAQGVVSQPPVPAPEKSILQDLPPPPAPAPGASGAPANSPPRIPAPPGIPATPPHR